MSAGLYLQASSLLSKWGFNDGDEPDELLDRLESEGIDPWHPDLEWRAVLYELVRVHLLPLIPRAVELGSPLLGIHNPASAVRIDGVDVSDLHRAHPSQVDFQYPDLNAIDVEVPWPTVLAAVRSAAFPSEATGTLTCERATIHEPHEWRGARDWWSCPGVRGTGPRHADVAPR